MEIKYKNKLFDSNSSPISDNRVREELTLIELWERTLNCKDCQLANCRTKTVLARGETENPLVFVIGEAPGKTEDREGVAMVGKSGELLDKMLDAIAIADKCYITNVVRCHPPNNRTPEAEEIQACFHYLETEIRILKPKVILCLGATAAQTLLKSKVKFANLRNKRFNYYEYPVFCTYHPAYLLRNPSLSPDSPKWQAWSDLCQLKLYLQKLETDEHY